MRRRDFITLLSGTAAAWPFAARAQQTAKLPRLGFLTAGSPGVGSPGLLGLLEGLRQLDWIEGKTIIIEYRYAENRNDRLPELAAELVRLKADVIVAAGTLAPFAAKRATITIPIVMTSAGDPLENGLVATLAHPGGNVTGLSLMMSDISGKRLELLKELVPRLSRVAVLWNSSGDSPNVGTAELLRACRYLTKRLSQPIHPDPRRAEEGTDGAVAYCAADASPQEPQREEWTGAYPRYGLHPRAARRD
jgi:putative tryptophan/tyrosine transport system substrate-binding protein